MTAFFFRTLELEVYQGLGLRVLPGSKYPNTEFFVKASLPGHLDPFRDNKDNAYFGHYHVYDSFPKSGAPCQQRPQHIKALIIATP